MYISSQWRNYKATVSNRYLETKEGLGACLLWAALPIMCEERPASFASCVETCRGPTLWLAALSYTLCCLLYRQHVHVLLIRCCRNVEWIEGCYLAFVSSHL